MRGGAREKKKIKYGDQALLAAIWEAHGGPGEVAKKLSAYMHEKIHWQAPINWRTRGQVPHRYVKKVAEALNINPIGLNYNILFNLGVIVPAWEKVVRSYNLPENVIQSILFLKPPGTKKK
jgi:hypothetical protein